MESTGEILTIEKFQITMLIQKLQTLLLLKSSENTLSKDRIKPLENQMEISGSLKLIPRKLLMKYSPLTSD